jgi:hypothetical protein
MASKKSYPKVTKVINLDLSGIPRSNRKKVKNKIGKYLLNEILLSVGDEKSPVENGKYKKGLSAEYAKEKGSNKADLDLEGDLLNSLKFKSKGDKIEVGIFNKKQTGKADGHNQIHAKHKTLPERRFIPDEKQKFKKYIMNGIDSILDDAKTKRLDSRQIEPEVIKIIEDTSREVGINLEAILGADLIDELLGLNNGQS